MDDKALPPLPPSDPESMKRNTFDSFFRVGARDFWRGNKIEHIRLEKPNQCEHNFVYTNNGIECKKCRMGWTGKGLKIRDGALYFNNQKVDI